MGIRETEFQHYSPDFTDRQAAEFLAAHGEIVSVNGRVGANDTFVIAFATRGRVFGPMALNRLASEVLFRELRKFVEKGGT